MALATVCSLLTASAAAGYAYLAGPLLTSFLKPGSEASVKWLLWGLLGLAVTKALAQFLHVGLMQSAGQRTLAALRVDLYRHVLSLPPRALERRHSGDLLSRFLADLALLEFAITQALASYVKDSLQLLLLLGLCASIDLRLFALAFVALPVAAFPVVRFATSLRKVTRATQASLGSLTTELSELTKNLAAVLAFRGEAVAMERYRQAEGDFLSSIRRSLLLRGAFTPVLELLAMVGVAAVVAFGARAVFDEPGLGPKLLSFLAAALLMYQPMKALVGTFSQVLQGLAAGERLFELFDEKAPLDEGATLHALTHGIELCGVDVSYGEGRLALEGATLVIPAGKKVALVGASGAGKSTLFSVLLGFVTPARGEVLWDGQPLSKTRRSSLLAQVAWVPQEPVLFSGSVRQNLLLGRPDATEAELWEALERAHARGFVDALPSQLEERVGERGSRLSGGQRQRLAIARAFLRRPSLLLLDEPTSSLDSRSEEEVQKGMAELMRGRTTLVIAHRLATVRDADLIYVLERGRVAEHGSHAELTSRGGLYPSLLRQGAVAERAAG